MREIATTIAVVIVGRAITKCGAIEKRIDLKKQYKKCRKEIRSDNFSNRKFGQAIHFRNIRDKLTQHQKLFEFAFWGH